MSFRQTNSKLQDAFVSKADNITELPIINSVDDVEENFCDSPDSGIDVAGVFEKDDDFVSLKLKICK